MQATIALTVTERFRKLSVVTDAFLILAGSLFVGLMAQVSVPLPFTPVPITGQTLGVLLVAASLGSWRGTLSIALYLAEGVVGFPVFAGGTFGITQILGPTGGYLVGFLAAAYVTGLFAERGMDRSWKTALPAFLMGQLVIYLIALPWLANYVGYSNIWMMGFWPFLPGAVVKSAIAAIALPSAWKWVQGLEN